MIALDPTNANAYFSRGCCYDNIKKTNLALADYSKALELDVKSEKSKKHV